VVGQRAYALSVEPRAGSGVADVVTADGAVITGLVAGGELAGLVHVRDALIPGYLASLDELAHEVVAQVNAIHALGFDANGDPGGPFFAPQAATPGAAGAMALAPALLLPGGEALVAASNDAAAAGDNGAARAIAALRERRVLAGNTATFTDAWSRLVYRVGRDTQAAQDERANRAELVRQVELLRDSVSGISMDEEAANLMRFQRAYEANARYFQVVDQALATLLQMVGS
jgi:flagellar hook-associated protein 1 FlgK